MLIRKDITKISKKKSKVAEIIKYKEFRQMPSKRKVLSNQDDYIMFSGRYKEYMVDNIIIQLSEVCEGIPEVYHNGMKMIVCEKDAYESIYDLLFDNNSIIFNPEELKDGDIIQIVYITKNKNLDRI